MATVCGSSLALFDAGEWGVRMTVGKRVWEGEGGEGGGEGGRGGGGGGGGVEREWRGGMTSFDTTITGVPMSKSVAGVACGLVMDTHSQSSEPDRYQILSDLALSTRNIR